MGLQRLSLLPQEVLNQSTERHAAVSRQVLHHPRHSLLWRKKGYEGSAHFAQSRHGLPGRWHDGVASASYERRTFGTLLRLVEAAEGTAAVQFTERRSMSLFQHKSFIIFLLIFFQSFLLQDFWLGLKTQRGSIINSEMKLKSPQK